MSVKSPELATSPTTLTTLAFDPLTFDDGDVILRSGSVDFRVHSFMLRQASPFFRGLFSLPQPPSDHPTSTKPPLIIMDERPETLDKLLRWIYPLRHRPTISSIAEASALSAATEKLEIACAIQPILDSLTHLLASESNPLRAWALAVIFKHDEAKREAAIRFIRITPSTLLPRVVELDTISALQYADLLQCRQEAHRRALQSVSYEYTSWWGCKKCCRGANDVRMRTGRENMMPEWFALYRDKVADKNPLVDDVASDGLFDAAVANSSCEACKTWYESLGASYRPGVLIRRKLDELNTWISQNACSYPAS